MAQSTLSESGLHHALDVLRRRKWAGIIAFVTVLSLTAPFSVYLPDIYRATATILVEAQQASTNFVRPAMPELETRLVTIQQEILSRSRLSTLITSLNLYPRLRASVPMDAVVERMRRDIRVELTGTAENRGNPTTIGVKISYIGLDRQSAAQVPNALASMYVEENTRMRERQTGQMAEFLKDQLGAAQRELDRQQERISAFKTARTGELPQQISVNLATLERLNTQLRLNSENQLKARDRHDRLVEQLAESEERPGTAAGPTDQLAVLNQKLRELQGRFTDRHPDVIQLQAQIRELERQRPLDPSAGAVVNSATSPRRRLSEAIRATESELARLKQEEQKLESEIASYDERIRVAPTHEQELETLNRDYATAKESHDLLLKRYEEAQLAESLEQDKKGEIFRILDSAVVPSYPAAPNRLRLLIMALFFALASGTAAVLLSEQLDTSFHTVGELRQFTRVPVLASIPYIAVRDRLLSQTFRVAVVASAVASSCVLLAAFAYYAARENTLLVWMLAGPQL